jgi:ABC-type phosphate/phosphonate transport system substrate-binding protein
MRWVGTHDTVVSEVAEGRVAAGAAKDLRIEAYEAAHPEVAFRRLATSEPVPNNALVIAPRLAEDIRAQVVAILLAMHEDEEGRSVLATFGAERFVPCAAGEYASVRAMMAAATTVWEPSDDVSVTAAGGGTTPPSD